MNAITNQAQERAAWAWQAVEKGSELRKDKRALYGLLAKKLPSWLQVSGLGQTLAFLFSKSKNEAHNLLYQQVSARVGSLIHAKGRVEGMKIITELSPSDYRRASYELLRAAELLKRFADGRIDTEGAELTQEGEG
jgi:CRISPR-associated protein Cmr5